MDFRPNKTPAEIIKEGAFGVTYFRDIYSGVNDKFYKDSWKEFDVSFNKYGLKCGTSLRFWESKGWINKNDPYRWFQ